MLRLWAGWMVATVAWILHLSISYSLVEWYCRNSEVLEAQTVKMMLHAVTGLSFLLAVFGAWFAWRTRKRLRAEPGLSEFMAGSGVWYSLFLAVVILVEGIPNMVIPTCL